MSADTYANHLATVVDHVARSVDQARGALGQLAGVVFHSGTHRSYHADDRPIPFRSVPHFRRFAPVEGPDHAVTFEDGSLHLYHCVPEDFWEEAPAAVDHPYREQLAITVVKNRDALVEAIGARPNFAYVGDDPTLAGRLGIPAEHVEPDALMRPLDWYRGYKTDYEVDCTRRAAARSGRGYRALLEGFERGESERQLCDRYFAATDHRETDVAFDPIVAWDEKASILHYQTKRASAPDPGRVLLVDAGAAVDGYACDTTRTFLRDGVNPRFREIVRRLDALVATLIDRCRAGEEFLELHRSADREIAGILADAGVFRVSGEEAFDRNLTAPFFPHGLGHHMGLQVHDCGGFLRGPDEAPTSAPERYPFLRTTRPLEERHVVTIEPGIYFIPMLLEPFRSGADASAFDWDVIDELRPCGGVRIEDDVLVTDGAPENLTAEEVPR